jgi:hypothetical protein
MNDSNGTPLGRNGRRLYPTLGYLAGAYPNLRRSPQPPPASAGPLVRPPAQLAINGPQALVADPNGSFGVPQVSFAAPMGWPGYFPHMGPAYGMMPQHPHGFMQPGVMPAAFPPGPPPAVPIRPASRAPTAHARGTLLRVLLWIL